MYTDVEQYLTEEYQKKVGRNLKACRKYRKPQITQTQMAEILHVERQHIIKIENGKVRIKIEELMAYSTLFDIHPGILLLGDENFIINDMGFSNTMDKIFKGDLSD